MKSVDENVALSEYERLSKNKTAKRKMHARAAELRENSTANEDLLWEQLRNRQLDGRKFKRQVPIGRFIVDFYCAEEKLAVEVDGAVHNDQQVEDQERQQLLETLDIRFFRVTASDVENNIQVVLKQIQALFE